MDPIRIGILGFEGVMALDVVGPLDAFANAFVEERGKQVPAYEVILFGPTRAAFVTESGMYFKPHQPMSERIDIDTLLVPGGAGLRDPRTNARVVAWILERAPRIRRIATVCTGIYGVAATGLLDGRRVTTHWRYAQDVARRFPTLRVEPNSIFVRDGRFYTAAGVTAGIDLALALIEDDYGAEVALSVARELVVYLKRPGGQEQYSEPLRFQAESTDRIGEIASWIRTHLREELTVERLAERACLCPRQFTRRFTNAFHRTPAAFVEDVRLDEARRRLGSRAATIETVAVSVGFRSADAFRRAFERRYGINPSAYRMRFARSRRRTR